MEIITGVSEFNKLKEIAANTFGNPVKAVVDVDRELLVSGAELHSDLEALLLEDGPKHKGLWGINFYTEAQEEDFVELTGIRIRE
jgi:hypothetical protein